MNVPGAHMLFAGQSALLPPIRKRPYVSLKDVITASAPEGQHRNAGGVRPALGGR